MGIIDSIINGVTSKNDRTRDRHFERAAGDGARIVTETLTGNRAAGRTVEDIVEGRGSDRRILRGAQSIYKEEQRQQEQRDRQEARRERREARNGGNQETRTSRDEKTTEEPAGTPVRKQEGRIDTPVATTPIAAVTGAVTPAVAAAAVVHDEAEAPSVAPATTPLSQQGQAFWNAYSNIQSEVGPQGGYDFNRELLTYIQADERYVSYTEQYADAQGLTGAAREELLDGARQTHAASNDTLENSPGYSTDMQSAANDFFFVIEQSYPDSPAATADATPAVTIVETPAVTTAMGDIAMPASVEVVTAATPAEPAYDAEFTQTQLGELGQTPEEGITATPTTTPIAIEDMPIPLSHEEKLELGREQEDTSTVAEYTVERGDNLWKIAQSYYGLEDPKHIQQAVETIAAANGMSEGVQANRLSIGQVIKLPDSPTPVEGQAGLNWAALDADTARGLKGTFNTPASGLAQEQPLQQIDVSASASTPSLTGGIRLG